MGTTTTWNGAPDYMCDITPLVNVPSFAYEDVSYSDSHGGPWKDRESNIPPSISVLNEQ